MLRRKLEEEKNVYFAPPPPSPFTFIAYFLMTRSNSPAESVIARQDIKKRDKARLGGTGRDEAGRDGTRRGGTGRDGTRRDGTGRDCITTPSTKCEYLINVTSITLLQTTYFRSYFPLARSPGKN